MAMTLPTHEDFQRALQRAEKNSPCRCGPCCLEQIGHCATKIKVPLHKTEQAVPKIRVFPKDDLSPLHNSPAPSWLRCELIFVSSAFAGFGLAWLGRSRSGRRRTQGIQTTSEQALTPSRRVWMDGSFAGYSIQDRGRSAQFLFCLGYIARLHGGHELARAFLDQPLAVIVDGVLLLILTDSFFS